MSQRRISGVSWLVGQSISFLATAAAAVSKRKSMPVGVIYPWEGAVITLCPGCQEQLLSALTLPPDVVPDLQLSREENVKAML